MILLFLKQHQSGIIFNKTFTRKKLLLMEYIFCMLCYVIVLLYFRFHLDLNHGSTKDAFDRGDISNIFALFLSPILYVLCVIVVIFAMLPIFFYPAVPKIITFTVIIGIGAIIAFYTKNKGLIWWFFADLLIYSFGALAFTGLSQGG